MTVRRPCRLKRRRRCLSCRPSQRLGEGTCSEPYYVVRIVVVLIVMGFMAFNMSQTMGDAGLSEQEDPGTPSPWMHSDQDHAAFYGPADECDHKCVVQEQSQ